MPGLTASSATDLLLAPLLIFTEAVETQYRIALLANALISVRLIFLRSPQEFVKSGILRGFPEFLKSDVFGVGDGHTLCFQ